MKNRHRVLRAEHEWSHAELSHRRRVARQTMNAIQAGKYDPSLSRAYRSPFASSSSSTPQEKKHRDHEGGVALVESNALGPTPTTETTRSMRPEPQSLVKRMPQAVAKIKLPLALMSAEDGRLATS
jgi:hypothetical protein